MLKVQRTERAAGELGSEICGELASSTFAVQCLQKRLAKLDNAPVRLSTSVAVPEDQIKYAQKIMR